MNDITKLPKWAQDKIETMELRIKEAEKRARAFEEKTKTRVFFKYLLSTTKDQPAYIPDDRQIRFILGPEDWQYVDVMIRKTHEGEYVELMAGADIHIAPEVRNVSKIFVK